MFIDFFLLHVKAFKPVCANLVSGSYRIGDETYIWREKNGLVVHSCSHAHNYFKKYFLVSGSIGKTYCYVNEIIACVKPI
jgi:hypothetical protein